MSKIQAALQKLKSEGGRTIIPIAEQAAAGERRKIVRGSEIVEIDLESLRFAGLIAPECDEHMIANQFREIKRPLIANAYGKRVARVENGNLIMITSSVSGEGKTFISLNLAISIALEQDLTVLLVDADVAKPHISEVVGISEMPGLLDYLDAQQQSPESLVIPTDIEGLSILPSGAPRENATELLSGSRMQNFVQQLATNDLQRVVIFDTPPLLQTSESRVLLDLAGQAVLVVKAESTSLGAVSDALRILGDDNAVNLVLNQSRTAGMNNQYDYGYGITQKRAVTPSKGSD